MQGVLFAKSTILLKLHSVGMLLFILFEIVIALFAFGASERNSDSCSFLSHTGSLLSSVQAHRHTLRGRTDRAG